MEAYKRFIAYGLVALGSFYTNSLPQDKGVISGVVRTKPIYKTPSFLYPGEECTFTLEIRDKLQIIKSNLGGQEICSTVKEGDTLVIKISKKNQSMFDTKSIYINLEDIVSVNGKKFR